MDKLNNLLLFSSIRTAKQKLDAVATESDRNIMNSAYLSIRNDQDVDAMNRMESILLKLAEYYGMKAEIENMFIL